MKVLENRNSIKRVKLKKKQKTKKHAMHQKTIPGDQYSQINLFTTACDPFYYPWLFLIRFWFQRLDLVLLCTVGLEFFLCFVLFLILPTSEACFWKHITLHLICHLLLLFSRLCFTNFSFSRKRKLWYYTYCVTTYVILVGYFFP